ncbi:MAG: hypothetical protein RIS70_1345 [Planctomycetota bacterium]|jgi:molybdopterin-guanine dinucleotide biosynthesis protein A
MAAGIVLCGGKSIRMGQPKADLPFGGETLLERVVRRLAAVVSPVVVVAAPDQSLPGFTTEVLVVRDERTGAGPLEGLRRGLDTLRTVTDFAFVTSCDSPFVEAAFVTEMLSRAQSHDAAVPVDRSGDSEFYFPLAAVYRTSLGAVIGCMLDAGEFRVTQLFAHISTSRVDLKELREVDPELVSLVNVNHPAEYQAALRREGGRSSE